MRNLQLILQYDGTNYHGFQIQPTVVTVAGELNRVLSRLTNSEVVVQGCSRTDAGVHAYRYSCNFHTEFPIPADRLPIVLNNMLPDDIVAISCKEVPDEFNSRFDTVSKTYRYVINTSCDATVYTRNYEWQYPKQLDVQKMKDACRYFIGEYDFKSFMTSGSQVSSTVREIFKLEVVKNNDKIEIFINADGYLYNMVRIITGTLVSVGEGKISPQDIPGIIDAKNREKAGPTAPPQGLYLYEINY